MKIFAKKLAKNESGYSGDEPNIRGKFVLVTVANLELFPFLSTTTLNDSRVLNIILENGRNVGVNIVYHNAKFFPETRKRAHNEVRIYRNSHLESELKLDRGVIFVITETSRNGYYKAFSVQSEDRLFQYWDAVANEIQTQGPKDISEIPFKDSRLNSREVLTDEAMDNQKEIVLTTVQQTAKRRMRQPALVGDPGKILEFVINSQQVYADWVRQIYGSRCAIRGNSLIGDQNVGLEACHVMGHAEGGPLLPTNGILMSRDIHACFDQGLIGLDKNNQVIVSPTVSSDSLIRQFEGVKIKPIDEYEIFAPYYAYVEHHRNKRFKST